MMCFGGPMHHKRTPDVGAHMIGREERPLPRFELRAKDEPIKYEPMKLKHYTKHRFIDTINRRTVEVYVCDGHNLDDDDFAYMANNT